MAKLEKVNFMKLSMKDLISSEDVQELRDLWPYLKCSRCNELMIEPKMCITCNKNLCIKCKGQNCNHETIVSRHLKNILENLQLKCKFYDNGCNEKETYNYFKMKNHAEKCPAVLDAYITNVMDYKSSSYQNEDPLTSVLNTMSQQKMSDPIMNSTVLMYKTVTLNSANMENSPKTTSFTCSCGETFDGNNTKELFLSHKKECLQKKEYEFNQKEENNLGLRERLISEFMMKIEKLQNCFAEASEEKQSEFLSKAHYDMNKFHNEIKQKEETMKTTESELNEYYSKQGSKRDFVPQEYLNSHPEYMKLYEKERELMKKQEDLENKLLNATKNFNDKKYQSEKELRDLAKEYKTKLQQYEIEEAWLKETISQYNPGIISSVFSDTDTCHHCKNVNVKIKKYYCQECRKRFCAGTCAKICSTGPCAKISKYICPECVPRCGLCRKNVFCNDCKKKCFYAECKYTFCPDCYKKNGHQERSGSNNCAFFTCERDKRKACLMTSMFCVKCEMRLCNNCLFNDKEHFQYLFK